MGHAFFARLYFSSWNSDCYICLFIFSWRIPWTEEPGGLQSMGSLGVGHDWATSLSLFTFMHWRRRWQPTPVFLPGESQGWRSLVGCRLWGCTESDTTEATAAAVFAIVGFSKVSWMNIKSLICFWSEVWGSLSNHCVYMQAWKESNNNLCFTALVTECCGRLGSLVQKQHMRVMLEFWTLLESCCQDDWILHYLLWVPSPLYQKWLYNFEPLTSERLKVKINSRRHHCEIFGAREITIITGFIEGLLLVHDVAVPMFLSLELFEL